MFLSISFFGIAQVPGYRGKKFSLNYNAMTMPAMTGPFYSKDMKEYTIPGINFLHEANIDYVVSRSSSLGLSYRTGKSAVWGSFHAAATEDGVLTTGFFPYFINVSNHIFGCHFKFFSGRRNGTIAPLGQFNKLEIGAAFEKPLTGKMTRFASDGQIISTLMSFEQLKLKTSTTPQFAFIYSHSFQKIMLSHLLLNFSFSSGFIPYGIFFMKYAEYGASGTYDTNQQIFNKFASGRLAASMFFNFNLGIGILL